MSVAPLIATVVDWDALGRTVVAALVSGIGITLIFSLAIFGAARSFEYASDGKRTAATFMGGLALLAATATVVAVVIGIVVMLTK